MNLNPNILASKESEAIVIGTCLNDNRLMTKALEKIKLNDFGIRENKNIFAIMMELFAEGDSFDHMVLYTKYGDMISKNGGISYLSELTAYNSPITLHHHLDNIKRLSSLRTLAKTQEIIEKCFKDNANPNNIISELNGVISNINKINHKGMYLLDEVLQIGLEEIERAYEAKGITGVSTGYKSFDLLINGLSKGEYIVIGARPSMGKTAFVLNLLSKLDKQFKSLLVECDMSISAVSTRLLALNSYTEHGKMTRGKLNDEEFEKIGKVTSSIANKANIFVVDESNPKVNDIYTRAKMIKETKGLDVIVIDHIGKLKSDLKSGRYEQMTNISNSLKKLAKSLDVCVIALCQLSRLVEQRNDKRPMLSDLRDTGAIEEDADIVGFLYRDGYYSEREKKGQIEKDILELDLQKNRNGKLKTIYFDYYLPFQVIKER